MDYRGLVIHHAKVQQRIERHESWGLQTLHLIQMILSNFAKKNGTNVSLSRHVKLVESKWLSVVIVTIG